MRQLLHLKISDLISRHGIELLTHHMMDAHQQNAHSMTHSMYKIRLVALCSCAWSNMSPISDISRSDMEMEQRKQTTRIHVPVLPDHPDENTNGSSVYTRSGSSSLYDSDGDDDEETDTYAAALSKGHIPDRTTQSPLGPSSGLTPDMDSVTEGCGTSDTSGFPEALGSQKASVIEGQTSATERDETVEKDKSKRDSQTSHILTTCLNTIGTETMIELGKVRDSLKHTTIKGRSAERVVSFATTRRFYV